MKAQSYWITALSLVIIMGIAGCRTFDQGPRVSFKKAEERVANTWIVKEAVQNNVEITDRFDGGFLTFEVNRDFIILDVDWEVTIPPFGQDTVLTIGGGGTWDFLSDKNRIEILYTINYQDPYDANVNYTEETYQQWEIEKLYEDEMWLRSTELNMTLHLEPF